MPTKKRHKVLAVSYVTVRALMARINRKNPPVEVDGELVPKVSRIYTRTSVATGKNRDTLTRKAEFAIRLDKDDPEAWVATGEPGVVTGFTVNDFEKYARDLSILRRYEVLRIGRHDA
jgi:hypothetical protein